MESTEARLYHDHTLVKEPGTSQETPWHQDQPYYNIDGFQNVSFWIPVDPVPEEACMCVRRTTFSLYISISLSLSLSLSLSQPLLLLRLETLKDSETALLNLRVSANDSGKGMRTPSRPPRAVRENTVSF